MLGVKGVDLTGGCEEILNKEVAKIAKRKSGFAVVSQQVV